MKFSQAAAAVLPFGKYKGRAVGDVARYDDGLAYLWWLARQDWVCKRLTSSIRHVLKNPRVAVHLREVMAERPWIAKVARKKAAGAKKEVGP